MIVGIDLDTINGVAGVWRNGTAAVVHGSGSRP